MSDAEQTAALPVPAGEQVTAVPVIPAQAALDRRPAPGVVPAVQAAAAAAGGFVAGAAVVGLVHRHGRRRALAQAARAAQRGKLLRRGGRGARNGGGTGMELLQIVGSRSLLLDVHLLGGSAER